MAERVQPANGRPRRPYGRLRCDRDSLPRMPSAPSPRTARPGLRAFLALAALGLVGVAGLLPVVLLQLASLGGRGLLPAGVPVPLLAALSLFQSALLVLAAVALGLALAPRLGLVSRLAVWAEGGTEPWPGLRRDARPALAVAAVLLLATVGLELLFRALLGPSWDALQAAQPRTIGVTVTGVLYGGLAEELLTRWGLLSLVLWAGWRLVQRGGGAPRPALAWGAIGLVALAFGALHLPALAAYVEPTPLHVVRVLLLNGVAAVGFGWLFWRRSLEAAMLAHAALHVLLSLAIWAGVLG